MRQLKAISALLLLLFAWSTPLLAAVASGSFNNLPACCRRNGKHHCAMDGEAMPVDTTAVFAAPHARCPFLPKIVLPAAGSAHLFTAPSNGLVYSSIQSHPAVFAQTEAHYRIACDRSRLKRGPPSRL
jgi:hypothetical protein